MIIRYCDKCGEKMDGYIEAKILEHCAIRFHDDFQICNKCANELADIINRYLEDDE